MDADQLTLRKTTFGGILYDDDWLVMWRGLPDIEAGRRFRKAEGDLVDDVQAAQ